ncbi:uncharacterized protein [Montipora capricornis]|uniref:uncharacterized protein n=1 Tax=Montipora capricornis TaxID=246305 RepID=UPI0035F20FA7
MNICNVCNFAVRPRQEGLQCDGCYRWQHRTCDTGISRAQYRAAVRSGEGIDWSCQVCMETPYFESSGMEEDMDSLMNDPSMPSASLPEPESLEESGTPLFSDENNFGEFTYNVHSRRPYATYWQCTMRPQGNACKASVTEQDGTFQAGKSAHNHAVEMGAVTAAKIISTVKSRALEDKFKPASAIVNEVWF